MSECVNTRQSNRESAREQPIMARHQRMPPQEAGYTDAIESKARNRLFANEKEFIYCHSRRLNWEIYKAVVKTAESNDAIEQLGGNSGRRQLS